MVEKIRDVFPIIESCESWLSQGRTGYDWGRRMRFASFIEEVEIYRDKPMKYDQIIDYIQILYRKVSEE